MNYRLTELKVLLFLLLLSAVSCQRPMYDEEDDEDGVSQTNLPLKISARSSGESQINYPAYIYAFAEDGSCSASLKMTDNAQIEMKLPPARYTIVAIAGLGEEYIVPKDPSLDDVIVMKENNRSSYFGDVVKKFLAHRLAMMGTIVLILEVLAVVFLPSIMKLDPYSMDYMAFGGAPSAEHLLGCDDVGRDLFARLIFGGRVSLMVGICSALISLAIGVPLGLFAGYFRGAVETVIMRCADIFMSFPNMILILVLASVLGQSVTTVTLVIGFLGWTEFARLIYASVLSVREKDYVESAKAIGAKNGTILLRYVLPNSFAPVIISFTFRTAQAIITESSLSFLGLGVQPPEASWGNILYYAQSISVLSTKLYMWVPAGVVLVLTVLSINFIGDGIRDALDTKMKI